jgi:hypothetical protein
MDDPTALINNSDFLLDFCRFSEGILDEKFLRKKYRCFNDDDWARLGESDELVSAIEAEKIRRIRDGSAKREKSQLHIVRGPDVLNGIMLDAIAIFDLGRYAITMQSLRTLANAGARQIMISCYTPAAIAQTTPACSGDPLPTDDMKRSVAPLSFVGTLAPTLSAATGGGLITVTASQPGFSMLTPFIWPAAFNGPSASTQIPF